ncbi:MAG: hypothetical protein U0V87_08685 [Acidobacteriota bacterium]
MLARLRPLAIVAIAIVACIVVVSWIPDSWAYDKYSTNRTSDGCAACHGGFRTSGYVSKVDGQPWNSNLHDVHRNTMLSGECSACHASARFPVDLGSAPGGNGLAGYSCSGCHGRSQDGTGAGTTGFGAGLRQRHWRGGVTTCVSCHSDSNPANKTVVAEKILPPFYANPGTGHPNIPDNPCNPSPAFRENFAASTLGLDNDGNGTFDAADPSCSLATPTPGETSGAALSQLRVTSHNASTRQMTLSYGVACQTTDNTIYYGPLDQVSTYNYTGQQCGIGVSGTYVWNYPASPSSFFFLIAGRDSAAEGSYGKKSDGTQRPPSTTNTTCPRAQNLSQACN